MCLEHLCLAHTLMTVDSGAVFVLQLWAEFESLYHFSNEVIPGQGSFFGIILSI